MTVSKVLHCTNHTAFVQETRLGRLELQNLFNEAICHALNNNKQFLNSSLPARIIARIINTATFGIFFKIYSIPALEEKFKSIESERKKLGAITNVQKRWRARLRTKLKNEKKTFEAWRIEKIKSKRHHPYIAAQKVKEIYSESHYTFTHGQAIKNYFYSLFITQLTKEFKPNYYNSLNVQFRVPETVPPVKNIAEFKIKYPAVTNDAVIAEELLSVDANFTSEATQESARYFYEKNTNIAVSISTKPLYHFIPDNIIVTQFAAILEQYCASISNESLAGAFYTISIPKKLIQNPETTFIYTSKPYGIAARDSAQTTKTLEDHLEGNDKRFQYRVLTSPLSLHKGVRAIPHNHLSNDKNKLYETYAEILGFMFKLYSCLYTIENATPETKEWIIRTAVNYKAYLDKIIVERLINVKGSLLSEELIKVLRA